MNFEDFMRWMMYQLGTGKLRIEENSREYNGRGYRVVYCHLNSDLPLLRGQFRSNIYDININNFRRIEMIIGIKSHKDNEVTIKDNYGEKGMRMSLKGDEDIYFPFPIFLGYHKLNYHIKNVASIQWIGVEWINFEYDKWMKNYLNDIIYIPLDKYSYFGDKNKRGKLIISKTLRIENERIEVIALREKKKIRRFDIDLYFVYLKSKYRREMIKKELEDKRMCLI